MDEQYKKTSLKAKFCIALFVIWFLFGAVCEILGKTSKTGGILDRTYIAIAFLIYAVILLVYVIRFISTEEFANYQKINTQRRYERKKQKGTLYKVSFFEKKRLYYVTVPIGLLGWVLIFAFAPDSGLLFEIPALLISIYTVFVITCMVLWRLRYYKRKDGSYF